MKKELACQSHIWKKYEKVWVENGFRNGMIAENALILKSFAHSNHPYHFRLAIMMPFVEEYFFLVKLFDRYIGKILFQHICGEEHIDVFWPAGIIVNLLFGECLDEQGSPGF